MTTPVDPVIVAKDGPVEILSRVGPGNRKNAKYAQRTVSRESGCLFGGGGSCYSRVLERPAVTVRFPFAC